MIAQFYDVLLRDDNASIYLSRSIVQERLSSALAKWLKDLVNIDLASDLTAFKKRQEIIGDVHARIKIPIHLVLDGAAILKGAITAKIVAVGEGDIAAKIVIINEMIDYAMLFMSKAYVRRSVERVRVDEAYRLFSLGQDVELERETQRASLMEWSQKLLFDLLNDRQGFKIASLGSSSFGLWVRHRAAVVFPNSSALARIEKAIASIDNDILPALHTTENQSALLSRFNELIGEIKYLLSDLFQGLIAASNARDPLTSALTRRFLPAILGREVAVANQRNIPLSLLMIDVDHFKSINDTYGHAAGDRVLRQMAEAISSSVRPTDYVIRYGGEEFIVVLIETTASEAMHIAERIRSDFESTPFVVEDGREIGLTISIGVAAHDGHPDFQQLIQAADEALYRAKSQGRNRSIVFDGKNE